MDDIKMDGHSLYNTISCRFSNKQGRNVSKILLHSIHEIQDDLVEVVAMYPGQFVLTVNVGKTFRNADLLLRVPFDFVEMKLVVFFYD